LIKNINEKLNYTEIGFQNVFEKFNEEIHGDINIFLSLRHTRKFGIGSIFAFQNNQYFAFDYDKQKMANFLPYTPLIILKTFDGKMLLNIRNKFYYPVKYEKFNKNGRKEKVSFPPKQNHP
jgi:hypothetical protein